MSPWPTTTRSRRPQLRATSYAVLGLLSFGQELSGFDMKRWADWSLKFFYWAPSFSQIYGELHKLEELGPGRLAAGREQAPAAQARRAREAGLPNHPRR